MRSLLLHDNPNTAIAIQQMLTMADFDVVSSKKRSGDLIVEQAMHFDLVVLGLNPDNNEMVIKRLRDAGNTSVIIVTGQSEDLKTKVAMLNIGADDYIEEPYDTREFIARVQAKLNLKQRRPEIKQYFNICVSGLNIDRQSKTIKINDKPVRLTPMEFKILELLALKKGAIVKKEEMLSALYPKVKYANLSKCCNSLSAVFFRLKQKFKDSGLAPVTATIIGVGYILDEPHVIEQLENSKKIGRPIRLRKQ